MTDKDHLVGLLEQMLLIRRYEEKCAELYQAEKIRGFLHLYIGEEAVAVGVVSELHQDDAVVATYREHGHALALGVEPRVVVRLVLAPLDVHVRAHSIEHLERRRVLIDVHQINEIQFGEILGTQFLGDQRATGTL